MGYVSSSGGWVEREKVLEPNKKSIVNSNEPSNLKQKSTRQILVKRGDLTCERILKQVTIQGSQVLSRTVYHP